MTAPTSELSGMTLADLIGNALDRVGITVRDLDPAFQTQRRSDDTLRVVLSVQELLREAGRLMDQAALARESIPEVLDEEKQELKAQRDELVALREADQATIASLGLVNKELADALEALLPWIEGDPSTWFDHWAEVYRLETGQMPPGKDSPMDLGGERDRAERTGLWKAWSDAKAAEMIDMARAALRKAGRS